ncbi:nicotinate phosphoribosyltransferase [Paraburkholderia sp. EG287A]|uniref:nicotinate phosphoribosyltransferase n=1 Tax=Paraburkholderia sp. EG287A TaxID=3237012 RepID=UPI0034D201BA
MNAIATPAIPTAARNGTNPMNLADFYKTGHPGMYPEETEMLVASFTPRADKYASVRHSPFYDHKVVWFGHTGFIKEFLIEKFNANFFALPKDEAVRKYKRRVDKALGAGKVAMTQIEKLYDKGVLPLEIRALPEGSRVNIKVPPVIFVARGEFSWLATYFESLFSCEMWKRSTVATIAFEFRKVLMYFARLTGTPEEFVNVQGHDFSMRGMSGVHDAACCGAGHQLSFWGTDTIPAIDYIEDYYNANSDFELIGCSVPATEHSVMTLRILLLTQRLARDPANAGKSEKVLRKIAEYELIRQLVTTDFPTGAISIVADSFDYWNVITEILPSLKEVITGRQPDELGLAKVVVRPDSGDPVKIVCGAALEIAALTSERVIEALDKGYDHVTVGGRYYAAYRTEKQEGGWYEVEATPELKGSIECLWETFGGTVTSKGFKLLDSHIGLIYGDGITLERAIAILTRLMAKGFASGNIVFGIGSFTYQMNSRDSLAWAVKANYGEVGGEAVEICKDPATDDGTKRSPKGLLRVVKEGDDYALYDQQTMEQFNCGEHVTVFRDSQLLVDEVFRDMRARLWSSWECPDIPLETFLKMAA